MRIPAAPWPETPEQWREVVDLAYGALAFEFARQRGFLDGGPAVDVARCVYILSEGKQCGYTPRELDGILAVLAEGEFDDGDAELILRVVVKSAASAGEHLVDLVQRLDAGEKTR